MTPPPIARVAAALAELEAALADRVAIARDRAGLRRAAERAPRQPGFRATSLTVSDRP